MMMFLFFVKFSSDLRVNEKWIKKIRGREYKKRTRDNLKDAKKENVGIVKGKREIRGVCLL